MPIFSKDGKNALFIHIPKSGGSSVERIGQELGWMESFSVRGKRAQDLLHYKATPQHFHADILGRIFNFEQFDFVFAIVRNPFQRLKSEYYWQLSQGITELGVEDWLEHVPNAYKNDNFIYDKSYKTSDRFFARFENVASFQARGWRYRFC